MVGGLVQKQDVRFLQKQTGQIDAGLFTAGKAVKLLGPLLWGDAQAVADLVHIHVHFVAAAGLEAVDQGVIFPQLLLGGPLGHGGFQCLHFPLGGGQHRKGGPQHILHGVTLGEFGDLGDEAQLFIGIYIDLSLVIVHFPGEDLEKGGLSAAVPAQNGHALPFLNVKGKILQQVFPDDKKLA